MNYARRSSLAVMALALFPLSVSMVACGSAAEDPMVFRSGPGSGDNGEDVPTATSQGTFGDTLASGSTAGTTEPATCASTVAAAKQIPVYLVFMFDKSGSMGSAQKWTSCSSGLKGFFADTKSAGIRASLQFFPSDSNTCGADYETPKVNLRALPNMADFQTAIDATSPNGGTPTLPAIKGAVAYAKNIQTTQAALDGGKVAIVLVTDGEPNDCSSTVTAVSNEVAAVKADIPTYVIGVGNITALNSIAQAGGTNQAYIVSTSNPSQTTQEFQNALATIRGNTLACDYAVPAPPAGKTLDLGTVNVVYTPKAAVAETLAYNKDCTGGGWRYDDPASPTKIQLCPTSCDRVRLDQEPKVEVQLGCATRGTNGQIPR